jgi:hypothetical protein
LPLPGYSKGRFAGCAPEGPALKWPLNFLYVGFTNLKFCLKGIGNGPKGQGLPFKPG